MRQILTIAVTVGALIAAEGCRRAAPDRSMPAAASTFPAEFETDKDRPDLPFLFIDYLPSNVYRDPPPGAGLLVAVWQDGKIIRAQGREGVGSKYEQGHVPATQVDALKKLLNLRSLGEWADERGYPNDYAYETLFVRRRERTETYLYYLPVQATDSVAIIRDTLLALPLKDVRPIESSRVKRSLDAWQQERISR